MKISNVIVKISTYLSGGGIIPFVPEDRCDGYATVLISGGEEKVKSYAGGGELFRIPVELKITSDGGGAEGAIHVIEIFDKIAEYIKKNPLPIEGVEFSVCGTVRKSATFSGGIIEYTLPCAILYFIDGDEI